ncbi:MAG: family 1 glycosylhydrolase [Candidatus Nitrosopolaris sp.]
MGRKPNFFKLRSFFLVLKINHTPWYYLDDHETILLTAYNKGVNNVPVFVTENSVADKSDKYRAQFIISHLQQIRLAIDKGSKVIGYLHRSFMDNYEWLDNYKPEAKFGVMSISTKFSGKIF